MHTHALPTFTIVTPSYNQASFLPQTLESIHNQRGVSIEHIVMDGGSSDESVAIIQASQDRIAHWQSAPDGGQAQALHDGFARATGDILGWLNSDDYYMTDTVLLETARIFAANPDVDIVTSDVVLVSETGEPLLMDMVLCPDHFRMRYCMAMPQQSTFWRRSAYEAVGGVDPGFAHCMDFDLFQRLSQGRKIKRIPMVTAAFRIHQSGKTTVQAHVQIDEAGQLQRRYGHGFGNWLAIKGVTMLVRLESIAAEIGAIMKGRPLPTLFNARLEPMRGYIKHKHNLSF